jgi:pimeloyl-ACP methyl ester carboxylesterase
MIWRKVGATSAPVVAALALLWALLAQGRVHAQTPAKSAAWQATACSDFKIVEDTGSSIECGYVTVPLRHADPTSATIQLAVVVLPSQAADRQPDPLFMAQGGPGGSTIETYAQYLLQDPQARPTPNRDIVLWDQRGTLFSKPALLCPEVVEADLQASLASHQALTSTNPLTSATGITGVNGESDDDAAYAACERRLVQEAGNLSPFNSAENADDVDDVRQALGYDKINFYGVSYGTELGQFVMRRHPQTLRSVVLDAVVPLTYNLFTEPAFAKERIAEKYFNACAADPRCNAAFPNLAQRYLALIDRLNQQPVVVSVSPQSLTEISTTYAISLSGDLLESALYTSLYSNVHDLIPLIIDRADKGDYTYVTTALLPLMLFDQSSATGMYMSVVCADHGNTDPSKTDYKGVNPRLAAEQRQAAADEVALCKKWQIELLPRADLQPVQSDLPVLLLSGDFDPITPPNYAETLLPFLPNATHVVFARGAHGQAVEQPCANAIIAAFLDDPGGKLDTTCANQPVARFVTPADVITLPLLRRVLAARGVNGLLWFGASVAPGIFIGLFLLTAIPIYAIGWLIGVFRHKINPGASGWTRAWSHWAPWLALLAGLVLLAFGVGLASAVWGTLSDNQNLLLLGAISASWRWLFFLPPLFVLLVILMVVAAVALWRGHHHSLLGRAYYSFLTFAGLFAVAGLFGIGVMGLWYG